VDRVQPPTTLVLVSAAPEARYGTDAEGTAPVLTWQWVLRPIDGGRRSRLVVRQRLSCPPSQRLLWRLLEPVDFVMERKMLRGIKRRAEGGQAQAAPGGP
jgi:hypothetical protein